MKEGWFVDRVAVLAEINSLPLAVGSNLIRSGAPKAWAKTQTKEEAKRTECDASPRERRALANSRVARCDRGKGGDRGSLLKLDHLPRSSSPLSALVRCFLIWSSYLF